MRGSDARSGSLFSYVDLETKLRGTERNAFKFTFTMAAYNLIRMPRLLAASWSQHRAKRSFSSSTRKAPPSINATRPLAASECGKRAKRSRHCYRMAKRSGVIMRAPLGAHRRERAAGACGSHVARAELKGSPVDQMPGDAPPRIWNVLRHDGHPPHQHRGRRGARAMQRGRHISQRALSRGL
jgi:hypothetical protein